MKQTAYILAAAAMIAAGCSKEVISPAEESGQNATLVFTPEFDMEVEVKSVELGKADIWCFLYDAGTKEYKDPFKQSEINGTSYLYNIPKNDNLYAAFVMVPEGSDINAFTWVHHSELALSTHDRMFTKTPLELYMSDFASIYSNSLGHSFYGGQYYAVSFGSDGSASISREMKPAIHKERVMVRMTGLPEGTSIESVIRQLHVKTQSGMSCSFSLEEMYDETDYDYSPAVVWKCMDLYLNPTGDDYLNNYENAYMTVETTDNRLFMNNDIMQFNYYSFIHEHKVKINYDRIK